MTSWSSQPSWDSWHRVVFDHEVTLGSKHDTLKLWTMYTWLLSSAKTWRPCSLDALVNVSVLLRWSEAWIWWENNGRLVPGIVKTVGHETTKTVFMGPRSWWGLYQSVFLDFNCSMTGDRRKCASLNMHFSNLFFCCLFAFVYSGSCVWARCAKIATTDKGNMTYQSRCVTAWFKTWNILTLDLSAMAGLYLKLIGFVRQPPFCTHFCMAKVHSSTTVRYFYVRIERYTNVNFKKWDKTLNSVQIFGTNALSKQRTNC